MAGVMKLQDIAGTTAYIESAGLPAAMALAWLSALIEVGTGAAIILGKYFKEATLTLAAFIVIVSFVMHGPNSWSPETMQQTMFMKNMAIIAGLLFMAAHGAGNTWKLKMGK